MYRNQNAVLEILFIRGFQPGFLPLPGFRIFAFKNQFERLVTFLAIGEVVVHTRDVLRHDHADNLVKIADNYLRSLGGRVVRDDYPYVGNVWLTHLNVKIGICIN